MAFLLAKSELATVSVAIGLSIRALTFKQTFFVVAQILIAVVKVLESITIFLPLLKLSYVCKLASFSVDALSLKHVVHVFSVVPGAVGPRVHTMATKRVLVDISFIFVTVGVSPDSLSVSS